MTTLLAKTQDTVAALDVHAVHDGATDDWQAITSYLLKEASFAGDGMRVVDLQGRTYGLSQTLVVPTGIRLTTFNIVALALAAWTTSAPVTLAARAALALLGPAHRVAKEGHHLAQAVRSATNLRIPA